MSQNMRRNLVVGWLALLSAALVFMAWSQAADNRKITHFDEINVHRINIVEPDGKPRVIISNRERMAGLYWGGKEYRHHSRDEGGFLFFNDDGDEVGGLIFKSRSQGDQYGATSRLLFDQYKQQETVGLVYADENRQRSAGLHVWDQPDESIFPAIELSDRLTNATNDAEREKLRAEMKQWEDAYRAAGGFAERFFAGKQLEDSIVKLNDKQGRPRLVLKVDGKGEPSVEFLDDAGKVVRRIPEAVNP